MIDLSILGTTMRMAAPILLAGTGALYNDRGSRGHNQYYFGRHNAFRQLFCRHL